jgi:hypothetical protein
MLDLDLPHHSGYVGPTCTKALKIVIRASINRLYPQGGISWQVVPKVASLFTHATTLYFSAIALSCALLPTSDISTTRPVPLLSAMEKQTQHCFNRPLSTSKHSTFTTWTPKCMSVSSSQMIRLINYGTFKKHIYIHINQKIYLDKHIWHINL